MKKIPNILKSLSRYHVKVAAFRAIAALVACIMAYNDYHAISAWLRLYIALPDALMAGLAGATTALLPILMYVMITEFTDALGYDKGVGLLAHIGESWRNIAANGSALIMVLGVSLLANVSGSGLVFRKNVELVQMPSDLEIVALQADLNERTAHYAELLSAERKRLGELQSQKITWLNSRAVELQIEAAKDNIARYEASKSEALSTISRRIDNERRAYSSAFESAKAENARRLSEAERSGKSIAWAYYLLLMYCSAALSVFERHKQKQTVLFVSNKTTPETPNSQTAEQPEIAPAPASEPEAEPLPDLSGSTGEYIRQYPALYYEVRAKCVGKSEQSLGALAQRYGVPRNVAVTIYNHIKTFPDKHLNTKA